jgi:hypothetical protein
MAGGDIQADRQRALDNTAHYTRMRDSGHLDFIRKARRCEDFLAGVQWDPAVLAKLQAEGRPALTINKIFPSTMSMMGEQLQNMIDVAFRPTASGNEETAKALDTTWLHIANSNMLDWMRAEVFDAGAISGRGFFDIRMDFDDNLKGDVRIRKFNNRNALVDPDADSYDPKDWNECATTKWLQPTQIAAMYDTAKAKELESRAQTDLDMGYDFLDHPVSRFGRGPAFSSVVSEKERKKFVRVIERQHKQLVWREHFVDRITGETRPIPTTWERDRIANVLANIPELTVLKLQAFVIRWTVSAFDILLFDAESPYKYFTLVPYFPLLVAGRTIGLVENQIGPQETINKTTSQELHIVNTTANSGWVVRQNALKNMHVYELEHRGAETGLVMEVDDVNAVQKIAPNQVPTGLDLISQRARQDQFETSLVNKSQLGIDREDVSGKAIERKQLRGPVNLGKALANLVRTEHLLARNAVSLIQAFYTEERMMRVTRKERGQDVSVDLVINQMTPEGNVVNDVTLGEYEVITSTVSLREQQEDTEFEQAVGLKELGVDISDDELIALSRLRNKKEILERLQTNAEERNQDIERERALKDAELEDLRTRTQVAKTDAVEKVARAKRTGQEEQLLMFEKQAELVKLTTSLQQAQNDAKRLELEEQKLLADIEMQRRELRLKAMETKARSNANARSASSK